ncbi:MAG: thrombospondin type 3 repeat-containing protein [Candidatus Peregrinibacteria bacterium GW2011_GWE2_39_6]|nr:MAG: thrombospondin type 3 repeat-containing protein [Candidatus Peregrinibacteria bacterium GW2011_GWE2_39_6]
MHFPLPKKQLLTIVILIGLLGTQILPINITKGAPKKDHLGLVAILVDENLYTNSTTFAGLSDQYSGLPATTLKARVDRYAEQIQETLPLTKSLIIRTQSNEKPENIKNALQKLYLEGDGSEDAYTQLQGIVLIGNIPLPVVNKNDNRYISMLPYVDFKDPVYLFNQTNTDFEPSPQVNNPEPEIWHGIIRPPSSGEEGNQLLAEYFDKNTLYRQGYSEFTEFEQKLLFADTIAEKKALTDTGVDAYQRFLDHWEENSYHWYTSDLARDLFLEVNGSIEGGDGKDNDGDNLIDEDPLNSYDDDGDGLIDEDDGNQYYGVDNDRDCWAQDPSTQDSNNDGRACYFGDNLVDEDGTDDNNNDNDLLWNEDPIGDLNNDGCSGLCNTDDDGDQADWDGDGWPNGWEIEVLDTKITKRRSPFWQKPSRLPQNEQDILNKMYLDEKYPTYDPLCYTSSKEDLEDPPLPSYYFNGTFKFHPEFKDQNGNLCQDPRCNNNIKNDDDEDGLCEEDTNDDNDKDQDGLVDEDRSGDKNDGGDIFEGLPDIQSKKIIDSFFKKYPELFKKYLADSNLWTDYTGRYQSSYTDDNGNTLSDRETIQGLIGKRDAYVQLFLKAINDLIEESIDKFANKFANDFPLIGEIEISGTIHYKENGETKEGKLEEFTFINHSVENDSGLGKDKIYLNGIPSNEITSVGECSIYRGSFEQGSDAQMVEGLRVFNYQTAGEFNEQGADYGGCYGGFYETPEYCFPEVSQNPIRDQAGTRKVEDPLLSVDYRSCYDFKEKEGLLGGGDNGTSNEKGYWYFADKFIKEYANLSEKLDKGKKDENDDQDQDGDYDQDDFDLEVQNIIKDLNAKGAYDVPVRDPGTIYLFGKKGDIHYLTFGAVLEALGINKNNQIEIGELFSGNQDSITIKGFSFDKDMEVTLNLQKNYITKKLGKLSEDIADALRLPSVLKHVEPIDSTINEQLEAGFSETLPVDRPRHTTFQDTKLNYQRIDYPDVYSVNSWDELVTMFKNEDEHLRQTIPGATNYPSSLTALLGTEIFQEQFSDALQWKNLNIDQKHQWVIENYLNPEAITFVAKPENGYESMYLVANGQADRLNMSFNANAVESDPDLEFNYPDGNYPEEELKPESSASTTTPETPTPTESNSAEQPSWFPFMWMKDIVNWAKALGTTVSYKAGIAGLDTLNKATDQFNTLGLSLSCGSGNINVSIEEQDTDNDGIPDSSDSDPNSIDNNENNIPDGADKTTNLSLEPLLEQILYANGETSALIKIKALDATGNFNNQDNFTHVDLTIIQGEDYVKILSTNGAELINGEATLNVITTTLPGTFILQAVSQKEGNPIYSNNLSLESKTNHLKLSTYLKQTSGQTQNYTTASLEDVLIKNSEDENVAVVHASNGQLEILKPDAYHADALLPTTTPLGIGIYENKTNQQLAFYSITPDNPTITIQNPSTPISGLVNNVKILDANPNDDWIPDFSSSEGSKNNVELKIKDQKIGLLEPNGNIYFKANSDLKLGWGNSYSAINNPHLHLTISKGEIRLFDVIIGTEKENLNIETTPNLSSAKNKPKETFFFNQLKKTINHLLIEKILAATNTFDTDNDRLRDLEELTIGTDLNNPDTDQDTFLDGHELENGYSPLSPNQPLFTDLSKNDESFQDVLSLYLNGIIKGYSDGSFRPNQSITREEFTKLNLGAICLNCTNFPISRQTEINNVYSKNPFPDQDINPNLNYCIAYSKNENLISGYQSEPYASYYLPKNAISRAEATKVLLETSEISTPLTTDSTLPWYTNYIISAQGKTLYPKNRFKELDTYSLAQFDPWLKQELKNNGSIKTWLDSPITRGEFAIMVGNLTKIQNCQNQDQDGDGLNDQTEIYQYETDPKAKDTDQGGVDDYTEIIKKQNPVDDPMDDNTNPGDQKPSNPVPPLVAPANLQTDSDKDGLSDAEEAFYKTDPFNTDSDTGGVNDFEEILKTLDPLNPADDNLSTNNQQSGAYLQGQYLTRATAYQTTENINNSSAETIFYTKEIPADANSKLFLKAEILDETNNIVTQDNSSIIEFIAVDPNAPYAEILRSQVKTTAGIAETEILANSISGYFAVSAQISPIPLPPVDTEVYVYPGQPTSLKINSDSAFLKAGGLNKTKLTIALYDQYGNLANFEPHRLTLTTEGPGNLDSNLDEDPEQIGIQITAYEGVISLDLTSGENEGTVIVLANIDKIESSLKIGVYENIQIQLSLTNESLIADETSLTSITAKAILGNNQEPLIGFNGAVTFGITDPLYGTLSSPLTVPMQDGQASTEFITGAQAGTASSRTTVFFKNIC